MAYYGAQVIHPKTIKPVENKNIPLYVKCFIDPGAAGTLISKKQVHDLPAIKVLKKSQVLMRLSSTDFSFVGEKPLSRLYELFAELKMRPNLVQSTAISILCCLDDVSEKIEKLALAASELFNVQLEKDLTLLTIRHYKEGQAEELTNNRVVVLEQKTEDTIQVLMR
jgi:aspartate kinase